ncbi:MAG: CsbD family protein [Deltaproteobacteria bacterium]|jgi:uncharacterized protein YjbJ (UPF0337 family)|nr:CsbD family protein [Deltaproteobacteria bacterium]
MSRTLDKVTGRAKEAAGVLLDDRELAREGRIDQHAAELKGAIERVVDAVRSRIQRERHE